MTASDIVTNKHRYYNALQFKNQITNYTDNNLYLFLGRTIPWIDDNSPPSLADCVETDISAWDYITNIKKFSSSDAVFSIPRYNWTTGTTYVQYTSSSSLTNSKFYVLNYEFNIYVCIENNNGSPSTIEPTGTSSSYINLSDGYVWKYVATVGSGDTLKFLTTNYMPVKTITSNDSSDQWSAQQATVGGEIIRIDVSSGGNTYLYDTNSVVSATSNTIQLDSSLSITDGTYNNYGVYISSGTGIGQLRKISGYVGSTRTATLSSSWGTTPDNTSTYILSPYVNILGDGSDASAYSLVNVGAISKIVMINRGQNYGHSTAVIQGSTGTGAILTPVLTSYNGLGKQPAKDLQATNVTISVSLVGSESSTIFTKNDYRIVGLLSDPLFANNAMATGSIYDCTEKIQINTTSTFVNDEKITGNLSGATAYIVQYDSSNTISVTNVQGDFQVSENITGNISSSIGTITSITTSPIKKYTGDILYVRNQSPIYRSSDQIENFKLTVKF